MRTFIAIELPGEVKSALSDLQREFKECGADVRWVKPENIHLTLRFLGEIDEDTIGAVQHIMESACMMYSAFHLDLKGAGTFPHMKSPRVVWAGLQDSDILSRLQNEIEGGLSTAGFKKEARRFVPHLTLGRFRSMQRRQPLLEKIREYEGKQFCSFPVHSVVLMKSELHPTGAQYTKIKEVFLK